MILLCGTEIPAAKLQIRQALTDANFNVAADTEATLFDACTLLQDDSTLFLLNNQTGINTKMALKIAYAMLKSRPIVINRPLEFQSDVSLFLRDLLNQRQNKFILCNYEIFESSDIQQLARNVTTEPVKYAVTKHESVLISSYLKAQFRA